jgi:hypothetical protein
MGPSQFVALGAWDQVLSLKGVMAAPPPLASLAQFSFW